MIIRTLAAIFLACFVGLICTGCNSSSARESLGANAHGVVTLNGEIVPDATITFHPAGTVVNGAYGKSNAEGKYELQASASTTGIAPGEYIVTVKKVSFPPSGGPSDDDPNYNGASTASETPTYIIPKKYGEKGPSSIRVTVAPGDNDIPLKLEK